MVNYPGIKVFIKETLKAIPADTNQTQKAFLQTLNTEKRVKGILWNLSFLLLFICSNTLFAQQTFTLKSAAKTSAGIYTPNGTLVRTLWAAKDYKAGTYKIEWDGKDNDGNTMSAGSYTAKVLSNNVQYSWEGVIGNTSANKTGSTVHLSQYYFMTGMAFNAGTAYFCQGYSEGRPSVNKFLTEKPQEKIHVEKPRTTTANTDFVVTDGVNTYWAGYDPYQTHIGYNFVYAKKVADDSDLSFANGVNFSLQHGRSYNAIGMKTGNEAMINGLAVQKNGNKLFIARPALNRLDVLDKTSGTQLQSLTVNGINTICIDPVTDQLWMSRRQQATVSNVAYTGTPYGSTTYSPVTEAFDGDVNTCFSSVDKRGAYMGLDLVTAKKIGTIRLFPKSGYESYLNNCIIQGSNTSPTDGFTDLAITNGLRLGQYTEVLVNSSVNYRYIRLFNPNTNLIVSEMQVYSEAVSTSATQSVEKYTVNNDGTLTSPIISIATVKDPAAMSVSPDGKTIVIADADINSQQLKAFDSVTGNALWTLGTAGGYMNDATVTNTKFYFNDVRGRLYEAGGPYGFRLFIAFQPDGSFWVNDPGNYRVQHYAADRTFIEAIMAMGPSYSAWADKNDPSKVGSDYLEFQVDNTKPISGSTGWKLVKNWGALISVKYDQFTKFRNVITLTSNGVSRTFACLRVLYNNNDRLYDLVELQGNAIRFTGKNIFKCTIDKDGSLLTDDLKRYAFQGFDGSNNPVWSSTPELLADVSKLKDFGPFPKEGFRNTYVSSTGKLIFYDYGIELSSSPLTYNTGYHLGAIPKGGDGWLWKTAKGTHRSYTGPFPGPEYYDIGNSVNNYAGSSAAVAERNIVTGYHGEFWKGSQTNMYNHYYDNGLAIGQFGTTGPVWEEAMAKMAGNAMTIELVKAENGDMYLWHGDESMHAGMHKWKISGLNTVEEQNIQITYPSADVVPITVPGANLMVNLPYDSPLANNTAGWTINPVTTGANWNIKTNVLVSETDASPDIFINCGAASGTFSLNRDLGTNSGLTTWTISGEISYQNSDQQGAMRQYMDILDVNGKILARLTNKFGYVNDTGGSTNTFYGNDKVLVTGLQNVISGFMYSLNPVEISADKGLITIKYAGYSVTTTIFDATADITAPKTMRAYFEGGYNPTGRGFDFKDMRFIGAKTDQTIKFDAIGAKLLSDSPFMPVAISSSGLLVNFSIVSGPATISNNMITITGAGTVVIQASQDGSALYNAAAPVVQSFTVSVTKTDQTIGFSALAPKTFDDAPLSLSATTSSGLPVSFSVISGPATLSGNTLTLTGTGTITVQAFQPGNTVFNAAAPVVQSFMVSPAATVKTDQTINFSALAAKTFGDAPFALTATASSGLAVSFSVISGPATLSGNTLTLTAAGTITVQASQAGNATYNAAAPVMQSFAVNSPVSSPKTDQIINFSALPDKTYGDAPLALTAIASSGLPVTFSIISGPATLSGNTITLSGAGTVTVQALQAGNATYNAAAPVMQSFAVNSPVSSAKTDQAISFAALPDKTYGDAPFTLTATANSGLPVSFSVVSGPATITGNILTLTAGGNVIVQAIQAGNTTYNAAQPVLQQFQVQKGSQTINFAQEKAKNYGEPSTSDVSLRGNNTFALSASSSMGLPVSFVIISGPATLNGNVVSLSGTGVVVVRAEQGGNQNIEAAEPVTQSIIINKYMQINAALGTEGNERPVAKLKAYPNPIESQSTIEFTLPDAGKADVNIYDLSGKLLKKVFSGNVQAEAVNTLTIDRNGMIPGLYVIRLQSTKEAVSIKVIAN